MNLKKFLAMTTAALCMVACSNDDEPSRVYEAVTGIYAGYTSAVFAYSPTPMVTADETMSVTANEDGTVDVVLASSTWGESTISNIAVEVKDGVYILKGEGVSVMSSMGGGTPKEYPCTLEGSVSSDKEDVEMAFTLSIMDGTTITFRQGDAPEVQE